MQKEKTIVLLVQDQPLQVDTLCLKFPSSHGKSFPARANTVGFIRRQ